MASEAADRVVTFQERARIVVILSVTGLVSGLTYSYIPACAAAGTVTTLQDKLVFALRWQVPSFLTFALGILIVAFTRLLTPAINPLNPAGQPYVDRHIRCLQNTLEQLVLNVPGQLILVTFLAPEELKVIPYLVCLFVVGRVLFWLGYPLKRAAGFALTMLPTIAVYCCNFYFLLTLGADYSLGKHQTTNTK